MRTGSDVTFRTHVRMRTESDVRSRTHGWHFGDICADLTFKIYCSPKIFRKQLLRECLIVGLPNEP